MLLGTAALGAAAFRSGTTPLHGARGWLSNLLVQSFDTHGWLSSLSSCRGLHTVLERQPIAVVPAAILQELNDINAFLAADSHIDGRRRSSLVLSAQSLPAPLPPHQVESELPSLEAHVRDPKYGMARCAVKWLRRSGRVPGQVHSLMGSPGPGGRGVWELNVHFDEKSLARMVRTFGRNGCTARVLQLKLLRPPGPPAPLPLLPDAGKTTTTPVPNAVSSFSSSSPAAQATAPASSNLDSSRSSNSGRSSAVGGDVLGVLRVKPVRVYMNAVTQRLEGIEMIYCPVDRVVLVDVPVRLANDEMAPGVRKGGWMCLLKRTVRYKALGNAIPPYIEINVRHLDLEQDLLVRDLPIPPGTKLYEKNFNAPVVRCTTDVGKE